MAGARISLVSVMIQDIGHLEGKIELKSLLRLSLDLSGILRYPILAPSDIGFIDRIS